MVLSSGPGFRLGGRPGGLPVIPSPRQGGMMGCAVQLAGGVNQSGATTPYGGHDLHDPHRPGEAGEWCSCHPRQVFQGAHMTVAQRVENELQLAPGSGHGADVAATAVGDPFPHYPATLAAGTFLTDSIAAQRTRRDPCLVIRPR